MIPKEKLQISLHEAALRGQKIVDQMPKVTFEQARAQAEWLKKNSKVAKSEKKGTPSA